MIAPYPYIHIVDVPRRLFPFYAWSWLIVGTLMNRVRWVLLDKERTFKMVSRWCQWFHLTPVLIRETENRYELHVQGHAQSFEETFRISKPTQFTHQGYV